MLNISGAWAWLKQNKVAVIVVLVVLALLSFTGREIHKQFTAVKIERDVAQMESARNEATKRELAIALSSAKYELNESRKGRKSGAEADVEEYGPDGKLLRRSRTKSYDESLEETRRAYDEKVDSLTQERDQAVSDVRSLETRSRSLEQQLAAKKDVIPAGRDMGVLLGAKQGGIMAGLHYAQALGPVLLGGWGLLPAERLDQFMSEGIIGLEAGLRF